MASIAPHRWKKNDYVLFDFRPGECATVPRELGGMSGGGVWHVNTLSAMVRILGDEPCSPTPTGRTRASRRKKLRFEADNMHSVNHEEMTEGAVSGIFAAHGRILRSVRIRGTIWTAPERAPDLSSDVTVATSWMAQMGTS